MIAVVDCHYTIEGSGPPLILVHGIGAARDTWRFMVEKLAQQYTVVRYDLRGHGESPLTEPTFELEQLVNDLERVRERAGFESAHIAGHSLGGMIGPAYARQYPDRVRSIALLSTAAFRTDEDSAAVGRVVTQMREDGIPNILPTLTDRWYSDAFIQRHPDIVRRRLDQVLSCDPETFLNVFRIYATFEMGPWLHEVSAPALVMTGEFDGGCNPRLNSQIHEALPNAELRILPGLKHSILLEAGPEVADHLIDFLGSVDA